MIYSYHNSVIESYKTRGLSRQQNVEEKPTVILYNYIDHHAGTPNKTKTKDTMSLDYSSLCYIASRFG